MADAGVALACQRLRFERGGNEILRGVDLELRQGDQVAVTGPSGSGKTSLLHCLSGLERPSAGRVSLLGQSLGDLSRSELARLRLHSVGFVFQSADLVPELTLAQNIALPLEFGGMARRATRSRVEELVSAVGLRGAAHRRPASVSGGEAQRAAVARALAARPSVVFADEPTGALDSTNRRVVLDLLQTQARDHGALLLVVTHDPEVAAAMDSQVRIADGRRLVGTGA